MKFAFLIWSNLKRKKTRTVFTVLSICMAFIGFTLLAAIQQAFTGGIVMEGLNRLIVRHKVSIIQLLPVSYKERMERIPGVTLATHQTWFGGNCQSDRNVQFMQCPVVPEEFLQIHPELLLPQDQKDTWFRTRNGAIVGRTTANKFKWKIGDKVTIFTPIWRKSDGSQDWEFEIMGIFDGKEKNTDTYSLFFHYDYFDEARGGAKGQVGWYTIQVKDSARAGEIAKQVDREFENSEYETKAEPEGAFVQSWVKQIGNIALITSSILGSVLFTILLVAGNTMSQAVRERTGEIGVLKAVGFTNFQVLMLVMAESFALSVLGGTLGLGLGVLIIPGLAKKLANIMPMFYFPFHALWLGIGLIVLLAVATGVFPALAAMRLRVADSLRRM